jgi:hypothetical protein
MAVSTEKFVNGESGRPFAWLLARPFAWLLARPFARPFAWPLAT